MYDETSLRILGHIDAMAEFGHRWMGSEGEKRTRDYLSTALERSGMHVVRQPFDYNTFSCSRATFSVAGQSVLCEPLAYAPATPQQIDAPILYVGQGLPEDFERLAGDGWDVTNAIVLSDNLRSFVAYPEAESAGATAFVLATTLPGETIRCGSVRFDRQPGRIPAISICNQDSIKLIEAFKNNAPLMGRLQLECNTHKAVGENIIARPNPKRGSYSRLVLSAHFDSFWNGVHAMDNLSGVATLIELAKTLPAEIDDDMEFVFFGGEELGSWGAAGYVRKPDFDPQEVGCLINLDAFGSKTSQLEIGATADVIDLCRQTTDRMGIEPDRWNCPPRIASDHKEFVPLGVPSVWIANNGADQFYHTPLDRVENMSLAKLGQVFKLSRQLSKTLAGGTALLP